MVDESAIKCYEDASSAEAKPALSALTNVNTGLVHSEVHLESSPRGSPRRRLPQRPPPPARPVQAAPGKVSQEKVVSLPLQVMAEDVVTLYVARPGAQHQFMPAMLATFLSMDR